MVAIVPREPAPAEGRQDLLVKFSEPISPEKKPTGTIRIHTTSGSQPILNVPVEIVPETPEYNVHRVPI